MRLRNSVVKRLLSRHIYKPYGNLAHEFCTPFSNILFSRQTQIIVSYFMHDEGKLVKGYSSKKTLDAAKHVTRCNLS